jgi:hypothetical protein
MINSCAEQTGLFLVVLPHLVHRCCSCLVVHRSLSPVAAVGAATSHYAVGLRRSLSFLRLVLSSGIPICDTVCDAKFVDPDVVA